jgi:hypothetical protein
MHARPRPGGTARSAARLLPVPRTADWRARQMAMDLAWHGAPATRNSGLHPCDSQNLQFRCLKQCTQLLGGNPPEHRFYVQYLPTGQGDLNDRRARHAACDCIHSAQSLLADNQDTLADEADAHAPRAAHQRTAVCAGAQRAAAGAALEAQATLSGSSTVCGQARSTTTRGHSRRGARELSGTRSRCSFRRRSRRPTPAARSGGAATYGRGYLAEH